MCTAVDYLVSFFYFMREMLKNVLCASLALDSDTLHLSVCALGFLDYGQRSLRCGGSFSEAEEWWVEDV